MLGTETFQIFGLIFQLLGEGLICFGIVGAVSGKVAASTEYNRQVLVATALRNQQEQNATIGGFKKNVDDQTAQLQVKLNAIQFQMQKAAIPVQSPSKCRFCGAKIQQEPFCSVCGKAN